MARPESVRAKSGRANGSGTIPANGHELANLRNEAVRMRIDGHRLVDIAAVVKRDVSTVSKWITGELHHRLDGSVEELRALELARLDELWLALRDGVRCGDVKAISAAVRVVAERCKIQGLRAPVRIEAITTTITVEMIDAEMARLNAELAGLARSVPGEVVDEVPAITATDAVAWDDPWGGDQP